MTRERGLSLKQSHRAETAVIRATDDDMIVQCDTQFRRGLGDIAGDRDILTARFGAAARVIVDQHTQADYRIDFT